MDIGQSELHTEAAIYLLMLFLLFRLLDAQKRNTKEMDKVTYLESVGSDKSLWCRLTLAVRRVFNYIILGIAGLF